MKRATEPRLAPVAPRLREPMEAANGLPASPEIFGLPIESTADFAVATLDPQGNVTCWNAAATRILGMAESEAVGTHFSRFFTDEDCAAGLPEQVLATAVREGKYAAEGRRVRNDGTSFWASELINALRDRVGELIGFVKITQDISRRRDAMIAWQRRQEFAAARTQDEIGQLTGKVSHDFNNLLAIIVGNLETLQRLLSQAPDDAQGTRMRRSVENAITGAERAALLSRRILAFARPPALDPVHVLMRAMVEEIADLLRRSVGERIGIEGHVAEGLWPVFADPIQLEMALLQLAVNARNAMPDGGCLLIEAENGSLDSRCAAEAGVSPGDYVIIGITDTGRAGLQESPHETATQTRGAGLADAYGLVRRCGGHVTIDSRPAGATVKVYLPRSLAADAESRAATEVPRGAETILVVEDDDTMRLHTTEILQDLGYRTYQTGDAATALRILRAHAEIALLLADVALPGELDGPALAAEALRERPGLKILFTSGYGRSTIVAEGRLSADDMLIAKPFTYAALALKLRDALDDGAATSSRGRRTDGAHAHGRTARGARVRG